MVPVKSTVLFKTYTDHCHSLPLLYRKFALKCAFALLMVICLWLRLQNDDAITRNSEEGPTRGSSGTECDCENNYNSVRQSPRRRISVDKPTLDKAQTGAKAKKILIISEARSGSSFLGDLLQQATPTYYSFEPLIGIDPESPLYHSLLYSLLRCQFTTLRDTYLAPIYWKLQYFKWNTLLSDSTDPSDALQLFNHTIHRQLCQGSAATLVKTIRFTLHDYWRTIGIYDEADSLSLKVVYLVRDPRAVMSSRYRMLWCQQTDNCTDSAVLCARMRSNLATLRKLRTSHLSGRIVLLRHEDLLADMLTWASRLLAYLGLPGRLDGRLVGWIEEHTSADDALANPHSTYRNIKQLAQQWKADLAPEELAEIEDNCGDVMGQLGYRLLRGELAQQSAGKNDSSAGLSIEQTGDSIEREYPLREVSTVWK